MDKQELQNDLSAVADMNGNRGRSGLRWGMGRAIRSGFCLALTGLACGLATSARAESGRVETLAVGGGPLGLRAIAPPVLNNNEQVAVHATEAIFDIFTGTTELKNGFFRASSGGVLAVVHEGDAAGAGGGAFLGFDPLHYVINDDGALAFEAFLTGTGGRLEDNAIYRGVPGSLTQIVRSGNAGPSGGIFEVVDAPALNEGGSVAFFAGGSTFSGLFRGSGGGSPSTVVLSGATLPDGGTLSAAGSPTINRLGQVAFAGRIDSGPLEFGFFHDSPGLLREIVRHGDLAPLGGTFEILFLDIPRDVPVFNNSSQLAYTAEISGGAFGGPVVVRDSLAQRRIVAAVTSPIGDGSTFSSFLGPQISEAGHVAFFAVMESTPRADQDNTGIFRGTGEGAPVVIARENQPAPDRNGVFSAFGDFDVNASGTVAFRASLRDTAGDDSDDTGLFLADPAQVIQVVREGQAVGGSTVSSFSAVLERDVGGRSSFNELGQLAYKVTLANGQERVELFTPELHYRKLTSGQWDENANWTVGLRPSHVHDVFVDPAASVDVTGPGAGTTRVRSLTIGGAGGSPRLRLNQNADLVVRQALSVRGSARITQDNGSLSVEGELLNSGTIELSGSASVQGNLINDDQLRVLPGGSLSAAQTFINRRDLTIDDGLVVTPTMINDAAAVLLARGSIEGKLDNRGQTTLTGVLSVLSTVINQGTFDLNGGHIAATSMTNTSGGLIRGRGAVAAPLTNSGGVIHADGGAMTISNFQGGNVNGGELRVDDASSLTINMPANTAFTTSGVVLLSGPNASVAGATLDNSGTIRGQGRISNSVNNFGSIRAEGGRLTLSGPGGVNGNTGQLETRAGTELFYTQGLAENLGRIDLLGGVFDNNNRPLTSTGSIFGFGTVRTGGLTNAGLVNVGGGDMDVFGPLTNNATFHVQSGSTARFFGAVSGSGAFTGAGAKVFFADVAPGSSPGTITADGPVIFEPTASLHIELGGTLAGQFDALNLSGDLTLDGELVVSLIDSGGTGTFAPAEGNAFEIISAAGGITGTFGSLSLPALSGGLLIGVSYSSNAVTLEVVGLPGDYNNDGNVDAADYVVWRKTFGQTGAFLPADGDGSGTVDQADYAMWRANFGATSTAALNSSGQVPEPSFVRFAAIALVLLVVMSPRERTL